MAIRMMVSKQNYEANPVGVELVHNYSGAEANRIMHDYNCPNYHSKRAITYEEQFKKFDDCLDGCHEHGPLYMRTTHVGMVIETRERNGYDDSDFYAIVWNPETRQTETVEYATTRGWSYPNHATVDASPEVIAEVTAYRNELVRKENEREENARVKIPLKGKTVKVIAGRKLPIGTIGDVFWIGVNKFKVPQYSGKYNRGDSVANLEAYISYAFTKFDIYADRYNVGLRLLDGTKVFVSAKNVEVVE